MLEDWFRISARVRSVQTRKLSTICRNVNSTMMKFKSSSSSQNLLECNALKRYWRKDWNTDQWTDIQTQDRHILGWSGAFSCSGTLSLHYETRNIHGYDLRLSKTFSPLSSRMEHFFLWSLVDKSVFLILIFRRRRHRRSVMWLISFSP